MSASKAINHRFENRSLFAVFSITVAFAGPLFAQWEPDVRLSLADYDAYTVFNNQHGIATSGDTVHAVWFDARHGWPNAEIYYRRSLDAGVTWKPEMRLTNDAMYSGYPSLAVVGRTLHVVYVSSDTDDSNIHYLRSTDAGVTWGPDAALTTHPSMQDFPTVAATRSSVHVIYHDEQNGNWEVYYRRSTDAGVTWEPEVRLTDDPGWSNSAGIVVGGQDIHVTWSDDRACTSAFDIYYKRSTDNGITWSTDRRLTFTLNSGAPSLAKSGQNLFIGFRSERDGNPEMFFKRSTSNGVDWDPDVQLTDDPALRQVPAIASSGANVHLVWQDYRCSVLPEIYYKCSTDLGVTWDADLRLTNEPLRSIWPGIAVGESVAYVIWCDDRTGMYNVYCKRNPTGNPFGIAESHWVASCSTNREWSVLPNPVQNYGQVLDHEGERFTMYDIGGRKIGEYRGDRIGEGLARGLYFLRGNASGGVCKVLKE